MRTLTTTVLSWHTRAGHHGLRLLSLHLLWIAWTLRGGVVAGLFPATAALHGILRDDARRVDLAPGDALPGPPDLAVLRARFRQLWHAELGPANRLGALLVLLWAVVLTDRAVVTTFDLGALAPVLAGAHTVGGVVLGVITVLVWPLQAHFDDGALALLRRCCVLLLGRPAIAALTALGAGVVLYAYVLVPGLVPVLGIAAPAAVATACLWRTGVLGVEVGAPPPAAARPPAAVASAR